MYASHATGAARALPSDFALTIVKTGLRRFTLEATQCVCMDREEAFSFFEDPGNLSEITPDWLDFKLLDRDIAAVFEGATYDYTIRLFGIKVRWQSRIDEYRPPERFVDIQVKGPYRYWRHLHTFQDVAQGTAIADTVDYEIPHLAIPFHNLVIKRQLMDIFTYRAMRIAEWASGAFVKKAQRM
jgi:hypothetical protein